MKSCAYFLFHTAFIPILFLGSFSVPFYARFHIERLSKLFPEGFGIFPRPVFAKFA
jgi:hypothetical protein